MAKKPTGRPTLYSSQVADSILVRLASGETLRGICRDDGLPAEATVRLWAVEDRKADGDAEGFATRYARARDIGLDCMADELLEIADDGRNDWVERQGEGQSEMVPDHDHIARSRLRVDTRKWMLSKLVKRFGDRTILAGDDETPLQVIIKKPA